MQRSTEQRVDMMRVGVGAFCVYAIVRRDGRGSLIGALVAAVDHAKQRVHPGTGLGGRARQRARHARHRKMRAMLPGPTVNHILARSNEPGSK